MGSQRSEAKVAALAFPISLAFIAYANFGVRAPLLAIDDPAETVRIIAAAVWLFDIPMALFYIAQSCWLLLKGIRTSGPT